MLVGCLGNPDAIAGAIAVPRGRVGFAADFVRELRTLMSAGSAAVGDLVDALSRYPEDRPRIVRNLLYLVAGSELTPFARPCPPATGARRLRFASVAAGGMIARIAAGGGRGWVPSVVTGGGVGMDHVEAKTALTAADGGPGCERLARLGILA